MSWWPEETADELARAVGTCIAETSVLCDVSGMALLSGILGFPILRILRSCDFDDEEPALGTLGEERRRRRDWLLPFMQNNQPKFLTKDELRSVAMRNSMSRNSQFDMGWIMAIEDGDRHDWYEPLGRRLRTKS